MTNSQLFKQAHKLAKQVIKSGDDYRVTFGACLKLIKAKISSIGIHLSTSFLKETNEVKKVKLQPFKVAYKDFGLSSSTMFMAESVQDGKNKLLAMFKDKGINPAFCSDFDIRFGW